MAENGRLSGIGPYAISLVSVGLTVWVFLTKPADEKIGDLATQIKEGRRDTAEQMKALRKDMTSGFDRANEARAINAGDISSLKFSTIEQETQHRCSAVVRNVEHQMEWFIDYFSQACPNVPIPPRTYWPPGPGPNGGPH